jgi:hypothetical protein
MPSGLAPVEDLAQNWSAGLCSAGAALPPSPIVLPTELIAPGSP